MSRSSKNLPRDANQRAKAIVDLSVAEPDDAVRSYLSAIGRKGGKKGGKARAKMLSDERRSQIASLGGLAKAERAAKKIVAKEDSSH